MALKGKSIKSAVPYIPEVEREFDSNSNPTVFWLKPKNMHGTYVSLERYSKSQVGRGEQRTIHPGKLFEADSKDFVEICEKVENFEFSEDFAELHDKGVMEEVSDPAQLRLLVRCLDPQVFQEIQNVTANWERLKEGEAAYYEWKELLKNKKPE